MIVITSNRIPKKAIDLLRERYKDVLVFDEKMSDAEKEGYIIKADAILSLLRDKFTENMLRKCSNLKVISNYAVGYDNIDVDIATHLNIKICNTPGVLTETTADLAFAIMLSVARKVCSSQIFLQNGNYKGWEPDLFLGYDIYGKTLGIIGAGKIGRAIARRAIGFNMKILYHNRHRNLTFEKETSAKFCDMRTILQSSDFISLNTPLTKETYHLIDRNEFDMMKPNVILVNTSRGAVINETALIKSLKEKQIAGCALDVFEFEPRVSDELLKLNNVVLTPHIGSASFETREKMAVIAAENIISVLAGKDCPNTVNK